MTTTTERSRVSISNEEQLWLMNQVKQNLMTIDEAVSWTEQRENELRSTEDAADIASITKEKGSNAVPKTQFSATKMLKSFLNKKPTKKPIETQKRKQSGPEVQAEQLSTLANDFKNKQIYNFSVCRSSKYKTPQKRILQIDFEARQISLIHHGNITKTYSFSSLVTAEGQEGTKLFVYFDDSQELELSSENLADKTKLLRLLNIINEQNEYEERGQSFDPVQKLQLSFKVIKEGYLEKKGVYSASQWHKRLVVIRPGELAYHRLDEEEQTAALNIIHLSPGSIVISAEDSSSFAIATTKESHTFRVPEGLDSVSSSQEAIRNEWIAALQEGCNNHCCEEEEEEEEEQEKDKHEDKTKKDSYHMICEELEKIKKDLVSSGSNKAVVHEKIDSLILILKGLQRPQRNIINTSSAPDSTKKSSETTPVSQSTLGIEEPFYNTAEDVADPKGKRPMIVTVNDCTTNTYDTVEVTSRDNTQRNREITQSHGKSAVKSTKLQSFSKNAVVANEENVYDVATDAVYDLEEISTSFIEKSPTSKNETKTDLLLVDADALPPPPDEFLVPPVGFPPLAVAVVPVPVQSNTAFPFPLASSPLETKLPLRNGYIQVSDETNIYNEVPIDNADGTNKAGAPPPPPPPPMAPPPPPLCMIPSPPPSAGFSPNKKKASVPMRPFHWVPVPKQQIGKSMWSKKSENVNSHIDIDELVEMFQATDKKPVAGGAPGKDILTEVTPKKKKLESYLDTKTSQNLGIFLSGFKLRGEELLKKLLIVSDSDGGIDTEYIDGLRKFAPEPELKSLYAKHQGRETEELTKEDRFLAEIARIPRLETRLDALLITRELPQGLDVLEPEIDMVLKALQQLLNSKLLEALLIYILAVTNIINSTNSKGMTKGIRLSTLEKMSIMRTNDKKKNLLQVVLRNVKQIQPNISDLPEELSCVSKSQSHSIKGLSAEVDIMRKSAFKARKNCEVLRRKKNLPTNEDLKFCKDIENVISSVDGRIHQMSEKCVAIRKTLSQVLLKFGESLDTDSQELFGWIREFLNDFKKHST